MERGRGRRGAGHDGRRPPAPPPAAGLIERMSRGPRSIREKWAGANRRARASTAELMAVQVGALGKSGEITASSSSSARSRPSAARRRASAATSSRRAVDRRHRGAPGRARGRGAGGQARHRPRRCDPAARARAQEGRIHPISQTVDEIVAIFGEMGFKVVEGRTSRTTSTTSPRSTSRPSIRRGRCTTPSICPRARTARGSCCARTPRRCRCAPCRRRRRPCASSRRGGPIAAIAT